MNPLSSNTMLVEEQQTNRRKHPRKPRIVRPNVEPVQILHQKRSRSVESTDVQQNVKRRRTFSPKDIGAPDRRRGIPGALDSSLLVIPDREEAPVRPDDKHGHLQWEVGDNLTTRYRIRRRLGEGTFGRVLSCHDRIEGHSVAIKVVRNVPKYRDAAMIELEVLNTLRYHDPTCRHRCVTLRHWFDYRNHVCLVFKQLGCSLYDVLDRLNNFKPFPVDFVRDVGAQVLQALAYMHSLHITHTDLKPENILLNDDSSFSPRIVSVGNSRNPTRHTVSVPSCCEVTVIDFGSATFEEDHHSSIISTRHYRAPEVVMSLGWTCSCDLWSMGCILVELLTGSTLFHAHDNLEHLAAMQAVLGDVPKHLRMKTPVAVATELFDTRLQLAWPERCQNVQSIRDVDALPQLRTMLREQSDASLRPYMNDAVDLIRKLLEYDPAKRLTAREALQHAFFTGASRTASPTETPRSKRSTRSTDEESLDPPSVSYVQRQKARMQR